MIHQTTGFGLGTQLTKGTAASTNFIRGRMGTSGVMPRYDEVDNAGEHTGIHQRATVLQSTPIRAGYIGTINMSWRLYPNMIGYALHGVGLNNTTATTVILTIDATGGTFTLTVTAQTTAAIAFDAAASAVETALELLSTVTVATVTGDAGGPYTIQVDSSVTAATFTSNAGSLTGGGSTATFSGWYYTHTFTFADTDDEKYLTAWHAVGESANRFDKNARDVRLSQLQLAADRSGIAATASGLALNELDATGSETFTAEVDALLSQANGSFTLTSSDLTANTIGTPRGNTFTIDNPLDEEEQQLHSFQRASLTPTGKDVSGTLTGLVFSEAAYSELIWGAAAGTAPVIAIPSCALSWVFNTPGYVTGAVPYSMTTTIAVAQARMQPFDETGGGQIIYDMSYRMTDALSAAPLTITLVNDTVNYTGT